MSKRNTIDYVCFNEKCKHNDNGFCQLKGVKPNGCINAISKQGYELGIEWRDKQISDLEAKLAESEKEKQEFLIKSKHWKTECEQLKQQLAEKNRFLRLVDKDYEKLEKQFEEKKKENLYQRYEINITKNEIEELNSNVSKMQSDIEFVAKQLEQIFLDFNKKVDDEFGDIDIKYITLDVEEVNFYLKDKIKSIKEGNDYVD